MNTIVKLVVAALVVVAAVLGFQAYKAKTVAVVPVTQDEPGEQSEPVETTDQPVATTTVSVSEAATTTGVTRVTDAGSGKVVDVAMVLATPGPNSTDSQRRSHADLVIASAVDTNTIVINACKPQPTVSRVRLGSKVYLVNDDAVERVLSFGEKLVFVVPAGGTVLADMDFERGPGVYGFGCDGSNGSVGMAVVTE